MLDIDTMRVAEACVAITVFVLVLFGTFRVTRAPFSGWWSLALLLSGATSVVLLVDGERHTLWGAVLSNAISVAGAACVWAAARSLRGGRPSRWWIVGGGAVAAVASLVENPHGVAWPGGVSMLVGMAAFLAWGAVELWSSVRQRRRTRLSEAQRASEVDSALVFMAVASSAVSVFYALRAVVFVSLGPSSDFYQRWTGPLATTLAMTIVLVVVTYAVAVLNPLEEAQRWRTRARRDDLTGLLLRSAFIETVTGALRSRRGGAQSALILADLDHFKSVNDRFGHAEGDRTLVAFSRALQRAMGPDDYAARWGGEEFVVFVAEATPESAQEVTALVDEAFGLACAHLEVAPTASYGVAMFADVGALRQALERADRALYAAKEAGRHTTVIDGEQTVPTDRGGASLSL